jgi:hypothetical protein
VDNIAGDIKRRNNAMNIENKETSKGIGFCGLLAIAFIVLKLCNVIKWSWLWVLSPIWIPIAISVIVITILFLISFISDKRHYIKRSK